jgi:hypothetical protein
MREEGEGGGSPDPAGGRRGGRVEGLRWEGQLINCLIISPKTRYTGGMASSLILLGGRRGGGERVPSYTGENLAIRVGGPLGLTS